MTESDAKTKWCPLSRPLERMPGARITDGAVDATGCIASACMAWRWSERLREAEHVGAGGGGPDENGHHTNYTKYRIKAPEEREGFCGLAGQP